MFLCVLTQTYHGRGSIATTVNVFKSEHGRDAIIYNATERRHGAPTSPTGQQIGPFGPPETLNSGCLGLIYRREFVAARKSRGLKLDGKPRTS